MTERYSILQHNTNIKFKYTLQNVKQKYFKNSFSGWGNNVENINVEKDLKQININVEINSKGEVPNRRYSPQKGNNVEN